jgi:hypothetical protein
MSRKHCLAGPAAGTRVGLGFASAAAWPRVHRTALLGLMAAMISTAWGQTSVGRISGSVTDASGSAVANATITVTSTETGSVRTAASDTAGFYAVTSLPIGHYTASVSMRGFQKQEQKDLNVVADGHVTADFQLKVGDLTQSVEVVAAAAEQISTDSGEMAKTIDQKEVSNLALNGGNYIELLTLVPGTVVTNPDQFSVTTSLSATNQNINGNRSDTQNLTVDGAFNLVAGSNGSLMNNVNSTFIQEVKVQTSNFSAEYGRNSGVAFNVMTKSGTDQFHGGLFEIFRNDRMDARNFFSVSKTQLRYNDFGGSIGGAIKKDKLFFFFGQEIKRLRQTQSPTRVTVPDSNFLNGIFASTIKEPGTSTPYPNNVLPPSLITADGKAIANVYRLMSQQASFLNDAAVTNNVILQPANPLNFRESMLRIDYHVASTHTLYGRWLEDGNSLVDPFGTFSSSGLPTTPTLRNRPGQSYLVGETWLPTPRIVNEFRANASWASQHIPPYGNTWERSTYGFQFKPLYTGNDPWDANGIPDVAVNGYANFKGPNFSLFSPSTDIQVADTATYVRGQHVIKAGFAVIRDRVDQNGRSAVTGNGTFQTSGNTNTTGNAVADMLLGNFYNFNEAGSDPVGFFRFWQPGAFVQDSWKATRRLSFEIGLRWEMLGPIYTQANNMMNFVPALFDPSKAVQINSAGTLVAGIGNPYNGLVMAGSGVPQDQQARVPGSTTSFFQGFPTGAPRGFYDNQNVFMPRFGFAYALTPKTVIRGGYGTYYTRAEGNIIFSQLNIPPITQITQLYNANLGNPAGGSTLAAPLSNIDALNPKLVNGYAQQFSFSVQRQVARGVVAEAAYVGNLGRHLLRAPDIDQIPFPTFAANAQLPTAQQAPQAALRPYPGYSSIYQYNSDSTMNYHALQAYVSKRAGNLFMTASYTFSKALGDTNAEGDNPEQYLNRHFNYGPTSFDRRHVFIMTYVWSLPRLQSWNPVLRHVMGSWMLNGIVRLQTGQYYSITGSTAEGTRRADYLGGSLYPSNQGPNNWFNTADFAAAPVSRLGDSGTGMVEGPPLRVLNLSLAKNFRYKERFNLKYQADFFNAINIANFSGLGTTVTSGGFGTLSSAYPPRQIQMSLKLTF